MFRSNSRTFDKFQMRSLNVHLRRFIYEESSFIPPLQNLLALLLFPNWTPHHHNKFKSSYGLEALGEDVSTLNIKPSWHPSIFPLMQSPIVVWDVWVICNHQMWHEYHVIYVHVFFMCVHFLVSIVLGFWYNGNNNLCAYFYVCDI